MTNTLEVAYKANVADLQAKSAIARAEVSATTSELNKLARAAATSGTGLTPELLKAAQASVDARAKFDSLSKSAKSVGEGSSAIAGLKADVESLTEPLTATKGLIEGLMAAFAVEKIIGLGTEFAALGTQITSAMDATGMSAEQLSGLRVAAAENDVEFQSLARAMTVFSRNISEAERGSQKQIDAFNALGISQTELRDHGNDLNYMLERVAKQLTQYADGSNKSALETAIFGGRIQGLAPILKDIAENGMAGVERHAAELGQLLNGETAAGADAAHKKFADFDLAAKGLADTLGEKLLPVLTTVAQSWTHIFAGTTPDMRMRQLGVEASELSSQIQQSMDRLGTDTNPLSRMVDQKSVDQLKSRLASVQTELAKLQTAAADSAPATGGAGGAKPQAPGMPDFGAEVAKMRTDMSQIASTWDGFQSGMLAKQLEVARSAKASLETEIKGEKDKVPQYTEVEQTIARLMVQLRQAAGTEAIAQTRTTASGITAASQIGAVQRLEQERASWQQLIALHKVSGLQLVDVQRQVNQLTIQIQNEQAAQIQQIAKADADTNVEIARINIQAEKDALDTKLQLNQINAQQKLAILTDLTNKEFQLNLDELTREAAQLQNQPVEYARVMDQIRVLKAKNVADLAALNRQAAVDAHNAANDEAKSWKGAVTEITGAESTFLGDYLTGRKTLAQSVIGIADDMALKEIQADARAITTRLLLGNTAEAQKKAVEAGGFAYHLLFNAQDVAATTTTEATKTAAVTAGETARNAVKTAAAAESKATSAALGTSTVMADAAKAAAGAYSAVAGIPYVGPILAPAAAGVAFAAVAAYSSLASSAGGDLDVDRTRLNIVHPRETIMPANVAGPMRDFFAGGGASGGGGRGISFAGDAHFNVGAPSSGMSPAAVANLLHAAVRNGNPKLRNLLA